MKTKKILLAMLCLGGTLSALPSSLGSETTYPLGQQTSADIVINNCILVKVNGKPITVMDVVKKMDLLFYRQYPDLADNAAARFQYYGMSWKFVLDSLVDDCLIMADAEEKEVTVTDGDIREELETYFGPDVVLNLDKMGMTIDEAYDLLNTELIVSKMTGMMVRSRALTEIHPKAVRQAYQEWTEKHPPQDHFVYRVVSVRSDDAAESERVADQAAELLSRQAISFEELAAHIGNEAVKVSVSDPYDRKASEISLAHLAILQTLAIGDHSQPIAQSSKGGSVRRIFFLEAMEKGEIVPFQEVATTLESTLTNEVVARYQKSYLSKLREQFGMHDAYVTQRVPENFEPFALR